MAKLTSMPSHSALVQEDETGGRSAESLHDVRVAGEQGGAEPFS